jgi:uncharacterized protein
MKVSVLKPLKPKATTVWLLEQTSLTFQQIADACGLNILEVEALADDSGIGAIKGESPLLTGELLREEITRCEQNALASLQFQPMEAVSLSRKTKERQYTPRLRRQDRPDAIAWILKTYPNFSDHQICRLLSTTPKTVQAIRNKTHANASNIKPRHPVTLGFCTEDALEKAIELALARNR